MAHRDVARLCSAVSVNADTAVVAANPNRVELSIVNDSANVVYLQLQVTPGDTVAATINNGIRLNANGGSWTTEEYCGAVRGIAVGGPSVLTVCDI